MYKRKFPFGAEVHDSGVDFRLWAGAHTNVDLALDGKFFPMRAEGQGIFSLHVSQAKAGMLYQFRLDGGESLPDPASKYQPQGIFGPSCIVDSSHFFWGDDHYSQTSSLKGHVFYEMHVGTFTEAGTWQAACALLPSLADLGITLIEMMPIAEFAGSFGWGYDGIYLYAPYHHYGTPDDLREFISQAHALGIGVILDVVYNHFGSDFECHRKYSPDYFHKTLTTDWGDTLNFDGENAKHVREFVSANALYWIEEFHFDGVRFDATQDMHDTSSKHIVQEISERVKKRYPKALLIAESEPQESRLLEEFQLSGVWNDDFHHSALVALTGNREAYYHDYKGNPQEILSAIKYGYLYQGQYYPWQHKARGNASLNSEYHRFVIYLNNHDQVANSTRGQRVHELAHPSFVRALTTLFLLSAQTPLLFQGQEMAASTPFHYFADHDAAFNALVWAGRRDFLMQFQSFAALNPLTDYLDPSSGKTFQKCKLKWEEKKEPYHAAFFNLHKALIALRKEDPIFTSPLKIDGALLNEHVLLVRYFGREGNDRLILCNFGHAFLMSSIAEPLFAPPAQKKWGLVFSSEAIPFGGVGSPGIEGDEWMLPAYTTYVLIPDE